MFLSPQTYLNHDSGHHSEDGEECHAAQPAQVWVLQDEEARPAKFLGCVRRVAHAVHPLHLQLLDEAAAEVAQLVEAELAVVAAHTAVSCASQQRRTLCVCGQK